MFFIGDKVTRNKYKNDIVFRIRKIEKDIYYLVGEELRLEATAKKDDLRIYEKEIRDTNEDFIIKKEENMIYGKVLHIDGDSKYLDKSLKLYKEKQPAYVKKLVPNGNK